MIFFSAENWGSWSTERQADRQTTGQMDTAESHWRESAQREEFRKQQQMSHVQPQAWNLKYDDKSENAQP